nr:MAG TPA: GABH AIV/GABH BLL coil heterodimer, DE NOVO.9A [Caudoviricetes sp.]
MGKMQEEIKALRRQNKHLENVVQRQRQHLSELDGAMQDYKKAITAHYAACAITFGEKREDCDTLWGWHLEVPADLVTKALENYTVNTELDKKRGVYVIGAWPKESANAK